MKVPRDSSTGTWTINMKKEPHVRLNNIQQLKFNRAPSITPVPKFQHRPNFVIACNTKVQLVKFYHKAAFSPSILTLIIATNDGHFATCSNTLG